MKHTSKFDYSITFPCYNAIEYTKKCINSMIQNGEDLGRVVAVDNGSTDGTQEYLKSLPLGKVILNKQNLGVGVALNQGVLEFQTEWTIVMDNDLVVSKGWIDNLIGSAIENNLNVISPALVEGELDYDLESFAQKAREKMGSYIRLGDNHAVCLLIHKSVWIDTGYFRATPSLLGYEDTLFFHDLKKKGIKTAISSQSWLHHFGSATQKAMKKERGLKPKDDLSVRNNHVLLCQNWFSRKLNKLKKIRFRKIMQTQEMDQFGMTVRGNRINGKFIWFGDY